MSGRPYIELWRHIGLNGSVEEDSHRHARLCASRRAQERLGVWIRARQMSAEPPQLVGLRLCAVENTRNMGNLKFRRRGMTIG